MSSTQTMQNCQKSLVTQGLRRSYNDIHHNTRAKYARQSDGTLKLLSIQHFTKPVFRETGYEIVDRFDKALSDDFSFDDVTDDTPLTEEERNELNLARALRRAKNNCFDFIECNPDLDTFVTLTISPEYANRTSWDECYNLVKVWLSNRVQRNGLKYVLVPEYHKDGKSIHFHAVMNSSALKLRRAHTQSGRALTQKGRKVFNIADVNFGWNSAIPITGENSTDKVAKYIFKYMGKQMGQRIGGRFYLHGGNLHLPVYRYGDNIEDFVPEGQEPKHKKKCTVTGNLEYTELFFI